jgi:hypothetical protein
MTDPVTSFWVQSLQRAYTLARAERLNELNGTRVRRFDAMGLHPESEAWGCIHAAENLEPVLAAVGTAPEELRQAARRDAEEHFANLIRLGDVLVAA